MQVTLIESSAKVLKEYVAQNILVGKAVSSQYFFGEAMATSSANVTPLDVTGFKNKLVFIRNSHDVAISIDLRFYKSKTPSTFVDRLPAYISLAAGVSVVINATDNPRLAYPYIGMAVEVMNPTTVNTGSIDITVMGSPI